MKRFGVLLLVCGTFLLSRTVSGQVAIEGSLSVHSVYRDNVYDFFDKRVIGAGDAGGDDAQYWDSELILDFSTKLRNNISVVATLQSNFLLGQDDNQASTNTTNASRAEVRQAYIEMKEFIWPQLTASVGLQTLAYDLRGDGNEFFLNTDERENRRWFTADSAALNQPATTAGVTSAGFGFAPSSGSSAVPNFNDATSSAAGVVKFTWDADPVFIDVFFAELEETGVSRDDHEVFGAVGDLLLGEDSLLRTHLLYFRNERFANRQAPGTFGGGASGNIAVIEFGIGASYKLDVGNPLELYGEAGIQIGDFGTNTIGATTTNVDQDAFAYIVGLRYNFENLQYAPWIDVSYWSLSGDDNGTDGDQEAWIPYGDMDDTLILEENRYGLGVNSGYRAAKFKTGLRPSEETEIKFVLAIFWAAEDKLTTAGGTVNYDENIGKEFDIVGTWNYTDDVTLNVGVGMFFAGDFFDDAVDGGSANFNGKSAALLDIGINARF